MRRTLFVIAFAGCSDPAARHLPDAPPEPTCMPTDVVASHAGPIDGDETWAPGVHRVTATVTVKTGTLTIAPCTDVRLAAGASIELSPTATALVADGTAEDPIRFLRDTADAPWGHVSAFRARISLAHATLLGGGATDPLGAALVVRGDATLPPLLHVDTVTVDGAAGIAVVVDAARFAAGSAALTVTRAATFPMFLGADALTDVPDGAYTGNGTDEILLQTTGGPAALDQTRAVVADVVIHDRGVPYRVGLVPVSINVGDGNPASPRAVLTIEAGVTLRFAPKTASAIGNLRVRVPGALVAAGTAARPVVFTSAAIAPAAGDWQGLDFRAVIDRATRIDHAVVEFAGGPSSSIGVCESAPGTGDRSEDSAVLISLNPGEVPPAFVTNTRLSASAGMGVARGWGVADVDFRPTNTFTGIAKCLQNDVPDAHNACPTTACPL